MFRVLRHCFDNKGSISCLYFFFVDCPKVEKALRSAKRCFDDWESVVFHTALPKKKKETRSERTAKRNKRRVGREQRVRDQAERPPRRARPGQFDIEAVPPPPPPPQ